MMRTKYPCRVEVSLRIMGRDLLPEEVSRLLETRPDLEHKRGDQRRPGRARSGAAAFSEGLWLLESAPPEAASLEDHLDYILRFVEVKRAKFAKLQEDGARIDIFVGIYTDDSNIGFSIDPDFSIRLGRLGLRLGLDIYSLVDDD